MNFKHIDESLHNNNCRYGMQTMPVPHPCVKELNPKSNTHDVYTNPAHRVNPTFRNTQGVNQSVLSGFNNNYQKCDGKGWVPHPVLDGKYHF